MKLALITDTHAGARNDSAIFNNFFMDFYENQFFPTIKERGVEAIIHLGDLFDRRKYINFNTLSSWREKFFKPCQEYPCHFILGNHDVYYKNTNDVASTDLLLREYDFEIYNVPKEVKFGTLDILFMPWINDENYEECISAIKETKSQVMFGHFQVDGFEMHSGVYSQEGMKKNIFEKFDVVLSGHFHHKSDNGTLYYLGNPYEMTWQDYADQKGFHIFDTESRELEFIPNEKVIFKKIYYDDTDKDFTDIVNADYSEYKNCYVKVVVQKKSDSYLMEQLIQRIEQNDPSSVVVVDTHIDSMISDQLIEDIEAEDTMSIVSRYIEALETNVNKGELDILMRDLHTEALQTEFITS